MSKKNDIAYGRRYEEIALEYLKKMYGREIVSAEILEYHNHKKEQGQGKDIRLIFRDGREVIYQVKSRRPGKQEFAFEVYEDGGRWYLKLPRAIHYAFFIPDRDGEKPFLFPVDYITAIFERNYDNWTQHVWRNNEGDGYCVYVSVEQLKANMQMITNFLGEDKKIC